MLKFQIFFGYAWYRYACQVFFCFWSGGGGGGVNWMLGSSLCSKKTWEYPLDQYYSWLKWIYQTVQTKLKMVIWCSLIRFLSIYHPPLTVYSRRHILTQFVQDYPESPKTFEQNYICWLVGTMPTNILQSVKILKQEGYDTLDNSPEFLALGARLYVRIDYRDRSMSLCGGSYLPASGRSYSY